MPFRSLLVAAMLLVVPAGGILAAGDTIADVEKDLSATMMEMESIRGELDRLEELAAFPRATGVRIEIRGEGGVVAPVRGRLLVQETVEDEREWSAGDRESFSGRISIPLVIQLPWLPGSYRARLELFHPSWKAPAAAEFRMDVRKGEVGTVPLLLTRSAGGASLSPAPGKGTAR
ncbi:MAG: hypothetical protein Kow00128_04270 [Deltaproteobacteria bacterium]